MNPAADPIAKEKWWETRVAEFLLTLASLALLAGMVALVFPIFYDRMHRPPGPEEEARFYKLISPHWLPKDIAANSVVVDRDDGGIYGELKTPQAFNGIRMVPLDKERKIWRYDLNGRSYAVVIHRPMNANWVLRSIQK